MASVQEITDVKETRVFFKKACCSSLDFCRNCQQMSTVVFFSENVCMKDNDHREMSLILHLEYYSPNKRNGGVTGVMTQCFVS
jgi:hypothetical protein